MQEKVQQSFRRRGYDILPEEILEIVNDEDVTYEKMAEYLSSHLETHEFHYADSSMIEGFVDWLLHIYVDACLK